MSRVNTPKEWRETLANAATVTVMTGAGMSAESGIATFRDPQSGLWARFRPEELASPDAFAAQPDVVWQWYQWRREQIRQATPHAGHDALARLFKQLGWTLLTQNVDGLHQRTGVEPVEFHGNIWREHCQQCRRSNPRAPSAGDRASHCDCGGLLRPSVVWFGETIPENALKASLTACDCDVFLLVGTSSRVYPAAGLSAEASRRGAKLLVLNPEPTPVDEAVHWQVTASQGLVALEEELIRDPTN